MCTGLIFGNGALTFGVQKNQIFEDMYFVSLKVLRENNSFSPCAKPSNGLSFWWLNCGRMVYSNMVTVEYHRVYGGSFLQQTCIEDRKRSL